MKIAIASLDQAWEDKKANMVLCESFIKNASIEFADLIIFPEMTLTGFSAINTDLSEDTSKSETLEWFSNISKKYGIDIIFGALLHGEKITTPSNMLCVSNSSGIVKPLYSKIHLFSPSGEDGYLSSGNKIVTHRIGDITFGFAICYDLRFPEIFSAMAGTCEAIVVIANWPSSRINHWNILLRARAIETGSAIFGVNRSGIDGNSIKYGNNSSMLVMPSGEVKDAIFLSGNLGIYEIDKQQLKDCYNNFQTTQDKRYDLYKNILKEKVDVQK